MHVHIMPAIMWTVDHSVVTRLLESGCKLNTLMGIKQTVKEGEEKNSNSKMNVWLHISGNNSLVT